MKESLFSKCEAKTTTYAGGGGVEILSAQTAPQIQSSSFTICKSGNDCGGVGIWFSSRFVSTCLSDCNFILCKITNTSTSDGGSVIVWNSSAAIGCSNTLFVDSHSEKHGGAVTQNIYNNAGHSSSIHLFSFCFFKNNSAKSDPGNDVYFNDWTPSEPFLHCFSLTETKRICYYSEDTYHTNKDNWLPHASMNHKETVLRRGKKTK